MKKFEIKSGKLVASDPCYSIPTWCQGIIENVKNGTWVATIDRNELSDWGNRICKLTVSHKDYSFDNSQSEDLPFDAGVDSGQFGFFDYDLYRNDEHAKDLPKYDFGDSFDTNEGDEWYRAICEITLGEESWGVLPGGVVSSSGFGDGSYRVYGVKDTRTPELQWVAFQVIFIDDSEFDEDDCDVCGGMLLDGECPVCNEL